MKTTILSVNDAEVATLLLLVTEGKNAVDGLDAEFAGILAQLAVKLDVARDELDRSARVVRMLPGPGCLMA